MRDATERTEAHESDVRRNPTKTPTARCVGVRYTNVNQCRFAEVMTDDAYYKAKKTFKNPLTKRSRCGIMKVQREGEVLTSSPPLPLKTFKKKLKKGVDNQHRMCYNKNVKRNTSYR